MSETTIRAMTANDWPAVEAIYAAGIQTGHATFEPAPPATWEAFDTGASASSQWHPTGGCSAGPPRAPFPRGRCIEAWSRTPSISAPTP